MTRASLREYAAVQRERYRQATRAEKRQLLDEVVAVAGIHRKAAIRLLRRAPRPRATPGPGAARAPTGRRWRPPPRSCGRPAAGSGPIGSTPSCPSFSIASSAAGSSPCRRPSTSSCGRRAARRWPGSSAPARAQYPPRGATITRPGPVLKHEIPIRTFTEWTDARPGFCEVDLVAHCGSKTEGFYLCTLCAVDIPTAWVELEPVWGKGQKRVRGAIHRVRTRLPLPLLGLDSDNGSEFINRALLTYCREHQITFTRSRPWKKNDSAHVEQKNGAVVRHSSAMIASPPTPPMPNSSASIAWPVCTSTSSSPWRSS